ncbi:hypothetical protein B0H14DRAFT_3451028 [Mycena olivaceomarginata]|nr:hypothetical protein B0H14DRAFT_3451028 [Mycena olivaceomarginata]
MSILFFGWIEVSVQVDIGPPIEDLQEALGVDVIVGVFPVVGEENEDEEDAAIELDKGSGAKTLQDKPLLSGPH